MEFCIVGIKSPIGVKSKKSGQDMNAYILHMVRENQRDDRLQGCEVKQQYVVNGRLLALRVGGEDKLIGFCALGCWFRHFVPPLRFLHFGLAFGSPRT